MTALKKPLVFIVEDNNAYRFLIGRILEKKGYMVLLFEHGRKAAEMLQYLTPSVILSDIEMPCMDGFEFHEYVQKFHGSKNIPFIYLSSTSRKKDKKKALQLSANEMLKKPISANNLAKAIEEVLNVVP